jgi:hypothetical protein
MPRAKRKQERAPEISALARIANTPGPGVIPNMKTAKKNETELSQFKITPRLELTVYRVMHLLPDS